MVALRYDADYIKDLMFQLNFNTFKDGSFLGDVKRLFEKYGWYKGDAFLKFMQGQIANKTGNPKSTFGDLKSSGFRDLYIVGTDLTTREYHVFSHESNPEMEVADAVRISMSIPLFFASRTFKNNLSSKEDVFVDGGVLNNYPITLFDDSKYNNDLSPGGVNFETLGFHLSKRVVKPYEISDLEQFVGNLFETILDVQDDALWNDEANLKRTVCIDNLGIQTTDFSITAEQKEALIKKGHEATANFLRAYDAGQNPTVCDGMKRNRRAV
jgi:NTE family protein